MQTFIYMLTFWCVGGTLILIVDRFEPDRQLAFVLEFVVLALGVAAIARRLLSIFLLHFSTFRSSAGLHGATLA